MRAVLCFFGGIAGGLITASSSLAADRPIGKLGDMTVSVPVDFSCDGTKPVTVRAPNASAFEGDRVQLQKLLGTVRIALGIECPNLNSMKLRGVVGKREVYTGQAAKDQGWVLTDIRKDQDTVATAKAPTLEEPRPSLQQPALPGTRLENQPPEVVVEQGAFPVGRWHGKLSCGQGNASAEVFISFDHAKERRFAGRIELYPVSHLSSGSAAGDLIAEFIKAEDLYRVAPLRWDRSGVGVAIPRDFTMVEDASKRMSGRFLAKECKEFIFERDETYAVRQKSVTQPPATGGSFTAVGDLRQRCEALVNWTMRIEREMIVATGQRQSEAAQQQSNALLFGDEDFVPVFGRAFDTLDNVIKTGLRKRMQECRQDALVRQRLRGSSDLDRPFFSNLTSFGSASITYIVQRQREVRYLVNVAAAGASKEDDSISTSIAKAKTALDEAKLDFWPSDYAKLSALLEGVGRSTATKSAERRMVELRNIEDPDIFLKSVNEVLNSRTSWMAGTDPEKQSAWIAELRQRREHISAERVQSVLGELKDQPATLEGVVNGDRILTGHGAKLSMLDTAAVTKLKTDWETLRMETINREVEQELGGLKQLPGGQAGLTASAEWYKAFETKFTPMAFQASVKSAKDEYRRHRSSLLEDAMTEFEKELGKPTPPGQSDAQYVDKVMARYLTWSGDRRLPVSLEYLIIGADRAAR